MPWKASFFHPLLSQRVQLQLPKISSTRPATEPAHQLQLNQQFFFELVAVSIHKDQPKPALPELRSGPPSWPSPGQRTWATKGSRWKVAQASRPHFDTEGKQTQLTTQQSVFWGKQWRFQTFSASVCSGNRPKEHRSAKWRFIVALKQTVPKIKSFPRKQDH